MLGNLIGGFIVIVIGLTLLPVVADAINDAGATSSNISSTAVTILGLTTLFFALGIASAGIAIAAQALRAAGLLG